MRLTTLEEERREVWGGILDGLRETGADPDRAAACAYLLEHLLASARYKSTGTT